MYKVERDIYGYATAISKDGYYILHLIQGSQRNEIYAEEIVRALNGSSMMGCIFCKLKDKELKKALGEWWETIAPNSINKILINQ